MRNMRRLVPLVIAAMFFCFALEPMAYGDEVAPELEGADLRLMAQTELKKIVAGIPPNDQKRLIGIYAAFDPNASDPIAQVACDDDGDNVVLLSDAMLRLLTYVARAASDDEANGSRKVEEYATFLARSQAPGRRLLPPPPGFYVASMSAATYDDRRNELLSFVVAREVAHFRAGDLVCPMPTTTKEAGDDLWTTAEQRKAVEAAAAVYPGRQDERDAEAIVRVLELGRTARGALALLRFFTQLEVESGNALKRFMPSYLAHHPSASTRAVSLQRTIDSQVGK